MKNEHAWLMHGDVRVARLGFDINGLVRAVDSVSNPEHLPVSAIGFDSDVLIERISRWWTKRAIPASRYRLDEVLAELGMNTPEHLMMKSLGLSLSDCYWIDPIDSQLSWDDVNHFKNDFSSDIGDLLIEDKKILEPLLESPDTSLNGNLKKRWKIVDGNRVLLKGRSLPYLQEPFNEVIASELMSRLNVDHVEYRLNPLHSEPYCACPCFCDENTEFIPAWEMMSSERRGDRTSYSHALDSFTNAGCADASDFLDRMITIDYLMANEDRHYGNFGLLRDPQSLETKGFAPLFDTGSSLGYKAQSVWIREGYDLISKPFKSTHREQIRLVRSFDWLDLSKLDGFEHYVVDVFQDFERIIDNDRAHAIAGYVRARIEKLQEVIDSHPGFHDDPRMDLRLAAER